MKNSDYWAQRFRLMNDALQDKSYSYTKNLETQYNNAIADIDTQMRAWYQRFAKNNAISYADAQKLLTSGQLKEFKWTVEEYIKKAQESAINGAWVKELENASARVHISRLEALKLQLRQQAEMLTGGRVNLTHAAAQQAYIDAYYRTAYEVQRGLGYGWSMQALNTDALEKVLSRPWTVDDRTFRARCWTDKNKLVQTVNNELTRMLATGAPPDKAIEAIVKQFGVSRANAGRLIMTESAHFAVLAQHDGFKDLDVEEFVVVETFDKHTCSLCGDMDGKHFPMSEFAAGANAPPFHPWCRGCIAPYFADMAGVGQRYSRNPDTGKREMLPANTTYEQWAEKYIKKPLQNGSAGDTIVEKLGIAILDEAARLEKHDIEDCYNTTNPNYSSGREYQQNCQRCVSAYEARRRGYDVHAAKRIFDGSDNLPYMARATGWPAVYADGAAGLESLDGKSGSAIKKSIETKMKAYGDGARAIVRVQWQGGGGHVFIAEQVGDATQFIDPQSGTRDCSAYFGKGMIKPAYTRLLRIDNRKFTDLIEKCVVKEAAK